MRTHELAAFLKGVSVALEHLPDAELTELPEVLKSLSTNQQALIPAGEAKHTPKKIAPSEDIHETLTNLTKREIVELLSTANLDIKIRSKDSAKDAAQKLRAHLAKSPVSARKIRLVLRRQRASLVSEPLTKALETLLGNRDEVSVTDN